MATTRLGLIPIVLAISFSDLATPSRALQSSLLSSLAGKDKSPVLLFLDNSALTKAQSSNRYDTDLAEVDQDKNSPVVALLNQLTQSGDKRGVSNYKKKQFNLKSRYRNQRVHQHDHLHRNKEYNDDRYNRDRYDNERDRRDRYRESKDDSRHNRDRYDDERDRRDRYRESRDRQQGRSQRGRERYRTYRQREDSHNRRPLRSDDKREQDERREQQDHNREQDREVQQGDREAQPKHRASSAQAQVPVIKSILRSLNCEAKNECQDECEESEKDECADECGTKYECEEEEEEEEDDSCDTCTTTKSYTVGGSTKGVRLETAANVCKRC